MRFVLIILTVFVMISMLEEMVAGQCEKGKYAYNGVCKDCNCGIGASDIDCNGNGKCRCRSHYAPPKCSHCAVGYFSLVGQATCSACGCHANGAKGSMGCQSSGQCTCYLGYGELKCDKCIPTSMYHMTNDHCCTLNDCYSRSQGKCIKCAENRARCDESTCECKLSYTGIDCKGVIERRRNLTWNVFQNNSYDGRYRVTGIHCHGNCDIRGLTMTLKGDIDMCGSTEKFRQSTKTGRFQTSGQFCRGISYSNSSEQCLDDNDKNKLFKGVVMKDTIHVMHYIGREPFDNPQFNFKVANFKGVFESDVPFDSTFT